MSLSGTSKLRADQEANSQANPSGRAQPVRLAASFLCALLSSGAMFCLGSCLAVVSRVPSVACGVFLTLIVIQCCCHLTWTERLSAAAALSAVSASVTIYVLLGALDPPSYKMAARAGMALPNGLRCVYDMVAGAELTGRVGIVTCCGITLLLACSAVLAARFAGPWPVAFALPWAVATGMLIGRLPSLFLLAPTAASYLPSHIWSLYRATISQFVSALMGVVLVTCAPIAIDAIWRWRRAVGGTLTA